MATVLVAVLAAVATFAAPATAQGGITTGAPPVTTPLTDANATRAQLTAALADADGRGDGRGAADLRARLREGDLRVGDEFNVTFTVDTTRQYTFQVRDSQQVDIPSLGTVKLRGVLRSELQATMLRFYSQFYRNPTVQVRPLVRIGFLGAVQKPGYYAVAPDTPVADAFTAVAGGPASNADLRKLEVKRGSERLLDHGAYERAARDGLTFDQVAMRSGDAIQVPAQRRSNRFQVIRTIAIGLSVFVTVLTLIRSANNY